MKNIFSFKNLKVAAYVLIGLAIFLFVGIYLLGWYGDWKFNRDLEVTRKEMERPYLEDTYGGKTPKETLEMFILSAEKEDFDLASKYFVLSKQEEWRKKLENGKKNDSLKNLLKLIINEIEILNKAEPLWISDDNYISTNNVLFEYVKYPQGNWKIKEI